MQTTKSKEALVEYYMNLPYSIRIIPEEKGGYFAEIEEFPGCMTVGKTIEEVIKHIEEVKKIWIETSLRKNVEIPIPREEVEFSGKFVVRIPKYLHKRLAEFAIKEGVSLNQLVVSLLSEKLSLNEIRNVIQDFYWSMEGMNSGQYSFRAEKFSFPNEVRQIQEERVLELVPKDYIKGKSDIWQHQTCSKAS